MSMRNAGELTQSMRNAESGTTEGLLRDQLQLQPLLIAAAEFQRGGASFHPFQEFRIGVLSRLDPFLSDGQISAWQKILEREVAHAVGMRNGDEPRHCAPLGGIFRKEYDDELGGGGAFRRQDRP